MEPQGSQKLSVTTVVLEFLGSLHIADVPLYLFQEQKSIIRQSLSKYKTQFNNLICYFSTRSLIKKIALEQLGDR
jgi:hypothetical protein